MNSSSGKVRRQTPFLPSKHITQPDLKRKLTPIPPGGDYSFLPRTIYENQLNRKKSKNGRSKMRSQFNKYIISNNIEYNDEERQCEDHYEFSSASFYSNVYPKTEIEGDFTVFSAPLVDSSVNSIQRQVFNAQLGKLRRLRTDSNRRKRKLERRGKKLFEKRIRALKSAPPLFIAPSPINLDLGRNRMVSVSGFGNYYSGRVH